MISFKKWLEQTAAPAPVATTAGSPGATTSNAIAPFLSPVGAGVVRRQYPYRKHKRKHHK